MRNFLIIITFVLVCINSANTQTSQNTGNLIIEGNIANAYIKIGNNKTELMPNSRWSKTLAPGSYDYEISQVAYAIERGEFTIKQGENTVLKVNLISADGETEAAFKKTEPSKSEEETWNQQAKVFVAKGGKENYAQAFALLKKSADNGNVNGMCSLGYMYEKGLGTKKDGTAAVKFYTLSANQNYAPAQYNLGLMYEYGQGGLKKNKNEAAKWYEKAAKQGFNPAQKKLLNK